MLVTISTRWWALGMLCAALTVVGLDIAVLNVALPSIAGALGAGTAELQWIVDAYVLAFAGAMLPAGLLGDRLGRKRVLLAGLALFGAGSVACALAGSIGALIAARVVMGLGAAVIMPLSIAMVPALFAPAERSRAITLIAASVAIGLPLGPVVGGLLLERFGWSAAFWINVPVVALTLPAGALLLRETRDPDAPRVDALGAGLAAGAVVAVVFAVVQGPQAGWIAGPTLAAAGAGVALAALFAWHERRAARPLVDPALFRDARFAWGTVAGVVVSFALYGMLFVVPQFLQAVHDYDALGAGLRLLPLMGGLLVAAPVAERLDRAIGTKLTVAGGLLVLAAALAGLGGVSPATGPGALAALLAACGIGVGAAMIPAMDAVMGAVPDGHAGAGAAVNNTLRQVGGALGVAILGSLLSSAYVERLDPSLAGLAAARADAARDSVIAAVSEPALRSAAGEAFTHGMTAVVGACALAAVVAAVGCLRYLPARA